MKRLLLLLLLVSCSTEPIGEIPETDYQARGGCSTMCELEPVGNKRFWIEQCDTRYYLNDSSGGTPQELSFSQAVNHCCEYGTGGGCDFPPGEGHARSSYVDALKKLDLH